MAGLPVSAAQQCTACLSMLPSSLKASHHTQSYVDSSLVLPLPLQRQFSWTAFAPSKRYTFRVAAWNAVGQGPASAPAAATTPGPAATVPGAPTITAVAQDQTSLELAVDLRAPTSDGGSGARRPPLPLGARPAAQLSCAAHQPAAAQCSQEHDDAGIAPNARPPALQPSPASAWMACPAAAAPT